jgi:hypothetical protein
VIECNLPDPALKDKLWSEITEEDNKYPLIKLTSKMQGFFQRYHQMELIKGYATNYYEVLPRIVEKRDREFTEKFMNIMNPCFLAREEDETAFKTLRDSSAAKNNDFFDIFLKK